MDKQTSEKVETALERLGEMIDQQEIVIFSQDEAAALKELVIVWRQIKGAVAITGYMGGALKWALGIAVAVAALKAGFIEWLKS